MAANDTPHSLNTNPRPTPLWAICQCPVCRPLVEERKRHCLTPLERYIEDTLRDAGLERPNDIRPMELHPSDR